MKKVIILEGPAGSGKTTAIQKMMTLSGGGFATVDLHHEFGITMQRPRNYGQLENPKIFALTRDILSYMSVINMIQQGIDRIVIDRGFFSNLVYSTIRSDRHPYYNLEDDTHNILLGIYDLTKAINYLLSIYDVITYNPFIFEIRFLIPDLFVIQERRERAKAVKGVLYPFDPGIEHELYSKIADTACQLSIEGKIGGIKCTRSIWT